MNINILNTVIVYINYDIYIIKIKYKFIIFYKLKHCYVILQ